MEELPHGSDDFLPNKTITSQAIFSKNYFEPFQFYVTESVDKGRFVSAGREFKKDEVVGFFFPFEFCVLDGFKKR